MKTTITGLPDASIPLGSTDKIAVVQGGFTKDAPMSAVWAPIDEFREWTATPTTPYSVNDPVFRFGIPYRLKAGGTASNDPATSPTDWEVVGGGGAQIGNIAPDPAGSKGNAGWTGTVSTIANGLTGFATELQITADSIQTIPIPTQLQGEALELRFEAVVSSGTGITAKVYSDSGATVEIPMSSTGINATGKTAFVGSFWAVGANVYLKISGTSFNLRATNFYVGRPETVQGAVVSEWQSYTPTISNLGSGSYTIVYAGYRRVGSCLHGRVTWTKDAVSGTGASLVVLSIPSGLTINGSLLGNDEVGTATLVNQLASPYSDRALPLLNISGSIGIRYNGGALGGSAFQANSSWSYDFTVPIAQWSSSMTIVGMNEPFFLSNSESVVNTNGVAAKTQIGTWAPILANTAATYYDCALQRPMMLGEKPKIFLWSKVDGNSVPVELAHVPTHKANINGSFTDAGTSLGEDYGIRIAKLNANQLRVYFSSRIIGYATYNPSASANSITWAQIAAAADGYDAWMVEISRGGEAWAVPPVVKCTVWLGANTAVASLNPVPYGATSATILEDSIGGWDQTNKRYVVRVPGRYTISGGAYVSGATTGVLLYKNGVRVQQVAYTSLSMPSNFNIELDLVAGDTISMVPATSTTFEGNASFPLTGNYLQLNRRGS